MSEQNLKNHVRFVPLYHFFVLPILIINFGVQVYLLIHLGLGFLQVFSVLLAAALFFGILYARLFALSVQDRLIRLEERLRYERVLPEELRWRADELTVGQFVSLRFACDDELPALMRKALDEKLTQRKAIKQLIKTWRPDHLRA
ncbi:MAG TPA: DUF6526 family protein [Candidatus Acidoferrum sp.]|nr:DUF6526 family protein [Candidatus Acidoferrum sp.]